MKSDLHEGIYGHWADSLRRLNIEIKYIPGPRNKVADGLSRTLFHTDLKDASVEDCSKMLADQGPRWIWKDGYTLMIHDVIFHEALTVWTTIIRAMEPSSPLLQFLLITF